MRAEANSELIEALHRVVSMQGDRPAFQHDDRQLTYAQLGATVKQKSIAYAAAGIGASAIVGIVADDPVEFLSDVFALLTLQTCSVLLPSDTTHWELERLSGAAELSHLLRTEPMTGYRRTIQVGRRCLLTQSDGMPPRIVEGPCFGFLTSGTTAHQKLALRTANAMLIEAVSMRHELDLVPGMRIAALVPLHHSFGFGDCALAGILAGAQVCTYSRMPPSGYLSAFERAVDVVALVPAQLRLLAGACKAPIFRGLSALSGGSPLDSRTMLMTHERLGCAVGQVYGTTETGVIAVSRPSHDNITCVGPPCRHIELRLDPLPPSWQAAAPETSAEGVVAVRSAALMEGYVTPGGIDRRAIRDEWFSTGDTARLIDGRLDLLGRLSSAINVAGVKVSPEEVEAALLEFPAVQSALVSAVEDGLTGQRIKAHVTPADVDLNALRRFCEERLSASKRPHYYEAVAALATTPSGKVIRRPRTATTEPTQIQGSDFHV